MPNLRFAKRMIPFFLIGGVIAAFWIYATFKKKLPGGALVVLPGMIPILAGTTLICIGFRYVRWQFLIRQAKILVPSRRGLLIFLASLIGIATPAYIGELTQVQAPQLW